MAIKGNSVIIMRDGAIVAGTKSNNAQSEAERISVASPTQGDWKESIPGRKSWSFSATWLMLPDASVNPTDISDLLSVGTTYTLRFGGRNGGGVQGQAWLRTCEVTAAHGSIARGSFKWEGVGPLSAVE